MKASVQGSSVRAHCTTVRGTVQYNEVTCAVRVHELIGSVGLRTVELRSCRKWSRCARAVCRPGSSCVRLRTAPRRPPTACHSERLRFHLLAAQARPTICPSRYSRSREAAARSTLVTVNRPAPSAAPAHQRSPRDRLPRGLLLVGVRRSCECATAGAAARRDTRAL